MIDDVYLPKEVLASVGGAWGRRRSNVSIMEVMGIKQHSNNSDRNKEQVISDIVERLPSTISVKKRQLKEAWKNVAEEVYALRSNNHKSNYNHVKRVFLENEALVAPLMNRCPCFMQILSHILQDKFGFRVQKVDYTSEMKSWGEEESRRIGCSVAMFLRKRYEASERSERAVRTPVGATTQHIRMQRFALGCRHLVFADFFSFFFEIFSKLFL